MYCGSSSEVFVVVAAGNGSLSAAAFAVPVLSFPVSTRFPTFAESSSRSVGVVVGICDALSRSCSIAEMGSVDACVAKAAEGLGSGHCGWSTLPMAPVTIVCVQLDDCSERVHARSTVIGVVEEPLSVIQAAATLRNPKADDAISKNALALGVALSVRGRAAARADLDCLLQTS